ncbi:MAG: hypothetical protein ABFE07_03940, partial [Armatimonadia bacterium]
TLPAAGAAEAKELPEAGVEVVETRLRYYVRPKVAMLKGEAREKCVKEWAGLPSAGTRGIMVGVVNYGGGVALTIEGRYAGMVLEKGKLRSVQFVVKPGSGLGAVRVEEGVEEERFWSVDLGEVGEAGSLVGELGSGRARGSAPTGLRGFAGWDLGRTAGQQAAYSECTNRTGFDGLGESFIVTVPSAQWVRAWVLCGVEEGKDAGFTARLTRFVPGGAYTGRARECLADTEVQLPRAGEMAAPGVERAGEVTLGGKKVPLWLVEVPLKVGDIQDLVFDETVKNWRGMPGLRGYLDFEMLGRLKEQDRPHPFGDGRYFPDPARVSGVHVFGVTLEKTPVEMEVRQTQPGNIFQGDEAPELRVVLRPKEDGEYKLRWAMRDVEGKACGAGEKTLSLKAGEAEVTVPVSLRQAQVGWYGIALGLWEGERELVRHEASFALLPKDTRQAGYESPYGTWWFDHHYGTDDPKIIGPMILKAGFRKVAYAVARHNEAELAPWKFTAASVGWGALNKPNATDEEIAAKIAETMKAHPHCDNLMIFHESMPNAPLGTRTAPELFGMPVQEAAGAEERWALATRIAKIARARFPELKIYIGNSGASSELIAEGMRRKFPAEYADYIGIETVGRTGHPEKLWEGGLGGVWLLRETARKFGYPWGVTSCFETNYREERLLGPQRHAEWYVRDVLLSHAYRFPHIAIALLHDTGNSYNGSFWGGTGLCQRYPLLYPKPAYVAMATVTRVLDRVTLKREVPTGSNCVYALEMARADGKTVYPVWTARGTAALSVAMKGCESAQVVDLYGRSRTQAVKGGKLALEAGTAVHYVVTEGKVTGIVRGRRSYPDDAPPRSFRMADAMKDVREWKLAAEKDPLVEQTTRPHLPYRTAGHFVLRGVKEAQVGDCVEVELVARKDLPTPLLGQYGMLRLAKPVVLEGEPTTLGMWVKGNSGWGDVWFETEDAAGVRRVSCGTVMHDADVYDYDGRVAVNFDGWAFLSFPMTDKSPIPDLSTGSVGNLWEATDRSKAVQYPVKLTGIGFCVRQDVMGLTEMKPMRQVLRFGGVGAY